MNTTASHTSSSMPDAYDRAIGMLAGLPGAHHTNQATVQTLTPLIGKAETYIVQTVRQPEEGDTIFLQCLGADRAFRMAIPPKVAALIARQRESLTDHARRAAAKRAAATRKERGIVPSFLRKGRGKKP